MRIAKYSLAMLLLAGTAFAQQGPMGRRMMAGGANASGAPAGGRSFQALVDYLKLTPQQVTDLQNIQKSMRDAIRPIVQQLQPKMKALRDALRQDPVDSNAVSQLRKDIEDLQSQIKTQRDNFAAQTRNVLTADQTNQLQALQQVLLQQRAAREAAWLGLITPPDDQNGPGMMGPFGGRRMMGGGPGPRR